MKVAFAGFGHKHIIEVYKRVLRSDTLLIAGVCEPNEKIAEELKEKEIYVTHSSYESLIAESDADIIAVGACFADRGKIIIDALKAGKHVFADKPICTRRSELEEIKRLVEETGLTVGSMLTMRYKKNILAVRDLIQKGELGEIHAISFGYQHPLLENSRPDWFLDNELHDGVITDIGVHAIDLIRFLTGLYPEKVLGARCWNGFSVKNPEFEDCAQFMVQLSNGAGVIGDVSYSIPEGIGYNYPTSWEMFGSNGAVRFSLQNEVVQVYLGENKEPIILEPAEDEHFYWTDFLNEVQGGKDMLLCTADVLRSTEDTIMIQEYADAMNGGN